MGKIYAKDHQNTPLRTSATLVIWCAQSDHFRPIFCTVLKSLTTYSVAMKSVIRKILYTCTSTITVLIGCCGFFSILLLNSRIRVHKLFPSLFWGAENPQIFTHYPGNFGNFSFFWVGARNPQIFFAPPAVPNFTLIRESCRPCGAKNLKIAC